MGLHFDKKRPDRGYAYVGASRAKKRSDVFLLGRVRRTDRPPVGKDPNGGEQEFRSVLSESDSEMSTYSEGPSTQQAESMDTSEPLQESSTQERTYTESQETEEYSEDEMDLGDVEEEGWNRMPLLEEAF